MRRLRFRRLALAALAASALTLTACGGGGPPPASTTHTPLSISQATATPGSTGTPLPSATSLPCNPASSTCWVPDVKDQFMSYAQAHHYSDARALAAAAHCQVLHPGQANVPAPTAARSPAP